MPIKTLCIFILVILFALWARHVHGQQTKPVTHEIPQIAFVSAVYVSDTPKLAPNASVGIDKQTIKGIVLKLISDAGFSPVVADRIILCESGYNPNARHFNPAYTDRYGRYYSATWDIGLWQINDVHGLSVEYREDIYKSTAYAIELMKSKVGLANWMCY